MSQIIGVDYSHEIIQALEKQLNNRGIILKSQTAGNDGTTLVAQGMGNRKEASAFVPRLGEQPSEETSSELVSQLLEYVENGLRQATAPVEDSDAAE